MIAMTIDSQEDWMSRGNSRSFTKLRVCRKKMEDGGELAYRACRPRARLIEIYARPA